MQLRHPHHPISDLEFTQLVEAKQQSFYRVAYGYVKHPEDALEIVQEAVCKAYVNKRRLRDPDRFYPWFYRILANTALSFLRRRPADSIPLEEWSEPSSADDEARWNDSLCLREALAQLDDHSRTAIVFKTYEDMTFREIAQVTGRPENTVKSDYYRGLRLLKERMNCHDV